MGTECQFTLLLIAAVRGTILVCVRALVLSLTLNPSHCSNWCPIKSLLTMADWAEHEPGGSGHYKSDPSLVEILWLFGWFQCNMRYLAVLLDLLKITAVSCDCSHGNRCDCDVTVSRLHGHCDSCTVPTGHFIILALAQAKFLWCCGLWLSLMTETWLCKLCLSPWGADVCSSVKHLLTVTWWTYSPPLTSWVSTALAPAHPYFNALWLFKVLNIAVSFCFCLVTTDKRSSICAVFKDNVGMFLPAICIGDMCYMCLVEIIYGS